MGAIEELNEQVRRCQLCRLGKSRAQAVPGEGHLLDLKAYHGIRILTPGEFVTLLRWAEGPSEA
ncbi:MAG: hypothetical protein V1772_10165 [Chloroflexota bacterium]